MFGLVIAFILIFAGYLVVTLHYAKTFKLKNEVLTIIEKYNGISSSTGYSTKTSIVGAGNVYVPKSAMGTINAFLSSSGYVTKGYCTNLTGTWFGVDKLVFSTNGAGVSYSVENVRSDKKYYYCFSKKRRTTGVTGCNNKKAAYFYEVLMFYKLQFPVISELFTFRVEGTTMDIYNINDNNRACTAA